MVPSYPVAISGLASLLTAFWSVARSALGREAEALRRWRKLGARSLGRLRLLAAGAGRVQRVLRRRIARHGRVLALSFSAGALLLLMGLLLRSLDPERRAGMLRARAQILRSAGQIEPAIDLLARAREHAPAEPRLAVEHASLLMEVGKWEDAEAVLRTALQSAPTDMGLLAALADLSLQRGRPAEVLELLTPIEPALSGYPDATFSCQALTTLGLARLARGRLPEAGRALRAALSSRSTVGGAAPASSRERARLGLAEVLWRSRRSAEAEALLREGLREAPHSPAVSLSLARHLVATGRSEEALGCLEGLFQGASADLQYEVAWFRAELLIRLGRFNEAMELESDLPPELGEPLRTSVQGLLELSRGNPEGALTSFVRLGELLPASPRPLLLEARASARAGRIDRAQAALERALVRDPGNREAERWLLELEERAGDLDAVRSRAERLLEDPVLRALGVRTLFALYSRFEDARGGLQRLELLSQRYPDDMSVRAYAAVFRVLSGDVERGLRELRQLDGERGLTAGLALLASAQEATSDSLEAIELLSALGAREDSLGPARLVLAQVYQRLGRFDLAIQETEAVLARHADHTEARLIRAHLALATADFGRAIGELETLKSKGVEPRQLAPLQNALSEWLLAPTRTPRPDEIQLAALLLEQVVQATPDDATAHARLARLRLLQGLPDAARAGFERARSLQPGLPASHGGAVVALLTDPSRAAAELRNALARTDDPRFGAALAAAMALAGNPAGAETALLGWLASAGDVPEGRVLQLMLLASSGQQEAARLAATRIAAPPEVVNAALQTRLDGAQCREALELFGLWSLGLLIEARDRSARLVRDHPKDPLLVWWAQRPLLTGGSLSLQTEVARLLAQLAPGSPGPGLIWAEACRQTGDGPEELSVLKSLRARFPNDSQVAAALGFCYERGGRTADAVVEYRRAAAAADAPLLALNNLACLLACEPANRQEAAALARRACDLAPEEGETWDTLGWVVFLAGETEQAEHLLAWAATLRPASPWIRYHLARALSAQGKVTRALNHLRVARLLQRPFPEAELAWALQAELEGKASRR